MPEEIKKSDRSFGLVFGVFSLLMGLWPLHDAQPARYWALVVSSIFFLLAVFRPSTLAVLNSWWMKLGLFLGMIISPLVMGLVFFFVVTPIGIVMRLFSKNMIPHGFDNGINSYWVQRPQPSAALAEGMKNQY